MNRTLLQARVSLLLYAVAALVVAACGSNPAKPTPTFDAPKIACPAPPSSTLSLDGKPVTVSFAAPTVIGGAPPVTTTCQPASGSSFGVGDTSVKCTVVDAQARTDACSFTVTVDPPPPTLAVTRIVAFGDSITQGGLGSGALSSAPYPAVLESMLRDVYRAQPDITVVNEGKGGEYTYKGVQRLPSVLQADQPQALLLQEGINDLQFPYPGYTQAMVDALQTMVRAARNAGARVFLGTLLPSFAGNCQRDSPCRAVDVTEITKANDRIRAMGISEGATIVDLFVAFGGDPTLIGPDGLHPNDAGYQRVAQTFFNSLRAAYEQPPPPIVPATLTAAAARRPR